MNTNALHCKHFLLQLGHFTHSEMCSFRVKRPGVSTHPSEAEHLTFIGARRNLIFLGKSGKSLLLRWQAGQNSSTVFKCKARHLGQKSFVQLLQTLGLVDKF
jgi:hypothetical protein